MNIRAFYNRILALPVSAWVVLGFLASYLLFFVYPIFFTTNVMQFYRYVPAAEHSGIDLKETLSFSQYWLAPDTLHYVRDNGYPPLASLLFVPLLAFRFRIAFQILNWLSILAYVIATLVLAPRMNPGRMPSSLPAIFCLTGLLSYGFQFELERGQFDVLMMLLMLLAVWIYHYRHSQRWAAYLLFSLSVQMKLYPLVFVFMFIDNWRDWRNNLRRVALLIFANIAFLLAFGVNIFISFAHATAAYVQDPYIWVGNHSIRAGVTLALRYADRHGWTWLDPYAVGLQLLLSAVVFGGLALIALQAYRKGRRGLNPHLFAALALSALLLPSFSHDYRLTILTAPAMVLFLAEELGGSAGSLPRQVLWVAAILLLSFTYASTLFPYLQKPFFLANNSVALLAMFVAVVVLALLQREPPAEPAA